MENESVACSRPRRRRQAFWGVLLMGVGVVLLMEQLDVWRIHLHWPWWPAIPIVIGLVRLMTPETPRDVVDGIGWILMGGWLFVCTERWFGFGFSEGWPLVLVIWGFQVALGAVLDRETRRRKAEHHVP